MRREIQGFNRFIRNAVLIIRNWQRALFVDYIDEKSSLGEYKLPPFLEGQLYIFEVINVPEEYMKYIACIAKAVEDKVMPLYKNKKLTCTENVEVVLK